MNQFLIANAQRCIAVVPAKWPGAVAHQQAQDVAALSTNHFAPRIRVVKSGDISTAMACRQCEDAPCASVCPQGAIQRDNDVWWVDQRRCIGCKKLHGGLPVRRDDRYGNEPAGAGAEMRSMPSPRRRTGLRGRLPDAGAAGDGSRGAGSAMRAKTPAAGAGVNGGR
ncbi:electron transport protein HydN [Klebsiella pneumoniae]|uniref:Electron transport protein HydN n=1 Tax=Klebsiella pneumoniae TaxID=573 RepID=A0A377TGH6_KLEPN|nr:electron transport protein HydN [Klebsiella pneumoniae]